MIESITLDTDPGHTAHYNTEYWVMCTRHKTWPQTQRLLPPSLTHHASCCLWVGFIFMPFCLSWQTGGSWVHRQHHCDHSIISSASLWSLHHFIIFIVITLSSTSLWSVHHLTSIIVIMHHQHHCSLAAWLCVLAAVMTNDGGMRCCDSGHCDCHQTEYRGWWTRQTVSRRTGDILYPGQCQHKISCRIYNCSIENAVWATWYNFSDVGH